MRLLFKSAHVETSSLLFTQNMDPTIFSFGIALVISAYESLTVNAVCPQTAGQAEMRAKDCLTAVGLTMQPASEGGNSGDADRLKQYCQDGTLDIALECVENILIECNDQNPHVGDLLSKSVSIDKLRNGFDYMCKNIDILSIQATCIELQTRPISQCVQMETHNFQNKIAEKKKNNDARPDDVWSLSCGFMDKVFDCQDKYYRENCGEEVANVLANFMQSVKPPVCAKYGSGCDSVKVAPLFLVFGILSFLALSIL
ncbi:uncharacterized protein LOC135479656 [Liolophura sinensis]|uniref:uncharacterized protein LOC135479656 n=1 Tax=Liolophura sinensis TaxID=3198878 RepID=UPI0031585EC5